MPPPPSADESLKLHELEAEAASARTSAATALAQLVKATARAKRLEALLEETEAETLTLKARADKAEADRDAVAIRLEAEASAARNEAKAAHAAAEHLREVQCNASHVNKEDRAKLELRVVSLVAEKEVNDKRGDELTAARDWALEARDIAQVKSDAAAEEVGRLENVLAEARAEVDAVTARNCSLRKDKDDVQIEVDALRQSIASLERDVKAKNAAVGDIRCALDAACTERDNGRVELQKLRTVNDECVDELESMLIAREQFEAEIDELTKTAKGAVADAQYEAANNMATLMTIADELRDRVEWLQGELVLAEKNAAEQSAVASQEQCTLETNLRAQISKLETSIAEIEASFCSLADAKFESDKALADMTIGMDMLRASLTDREASIAAAREETDALSAKVLALKTANSELHANLIGSNAILNSAVEKGEMMSKATSTAIVNANMRRDAAEKNANDAKLAEISALEALNTVLVHLGKLAGEAEASKIAAAKESLASVDDAVANITSLISVLEKRIASDESQRKNEVSELKDRVTELESVREDLVVNVEKLNETLRTLAEASQKETDMCERLMMEMDTLTDKAADLEDQVHELTGQIHEQDRAAEVTFTSLQAKQADLESQLVAKANELEELTVRLEEGARVLADALEESDVKQHKVEDTVAELRLVEENMASQTQDSQETIEQLQAQLDSLTHIRAAESKASSQLVEDAVAEAERLNRRKIELQEDIGRLKSQITDMTDRNANICSKLEKGRGETAEAQSAAKALGDQLEAAVADQQAMLAAKSATEMKLLAADAHVSELEARFEELRRSTSRDYDEQLGRMQAELEYVAERHAVEAQDVETKHATALTEIRESHQSAKASWEESKASLAAQLEDVVQKAGAQAAEAETEIQAAEASIITLSNQLDAAVTAADRVSTERDRLEAEIEEGRQSCDALIVELDDVKDNLAAKSAAISALQSRFNSSQSAIEKLERSLQASRDETREAMTERDTDISILQAKYENASKRGDEVQDEISKARHDRNAAQTELDNLKNRVVKVMEEAQADARSEIKRLETDAEKRAAEIEALRTTVIEIDALRSEIKKANEKISLADGALSGKESTIAVLERQLAHASEETEEARTALIDRESSTGNLRAKLMALESDVESQREIAEAATAKMDGRSQELAHAQNSITELTDRIAALELEQVANQRPSQSNTAANGQDASLEAEREMYEALEKYENVLEKNNRLRKRSKRLEVMLEIEKKKTAAAVVAAAPASAVVNRALDGPDYDLKRQVSPSTKGMSPSVKRARENMFRTPLSPMATNTRPPIAPKPALGPGYTRS
jgi:chromosome segregation ATPase